MLPDTVSDTFAIAIISETQNCNQLFINSDTEIVSQHLYWPLIWIDHFFKDNQDNLTWYDFLITRSARFHRPLKLIITLFSDNYVISLFVMTEGSDEMSKSVVACSHHYPCWVSLSPVIFYWTVLPDDICRMRKLDAGIRAISWLSRRYYLLKCVWD